MNDIDFRQYWRVRESSMNRREDAAYYARKATEHVRLMDLFGPREAVVDFGCGAGELLAPFHAAYRTGIAAIDFSPSLLERARAALAGTGVEFVEAEAAEYARKATAPRWMSCGAVNQYSDESALASFVESFAANPHASQMFLFDTIDPARLTLLRGRIVESYVKPGGLRGAGLRQNLRALAYGWRGWRLARDRRSVVPLGSTGYAVKLAFWRDACRRASLEVEFASSAEFEYRYHVVIRKRQ
jgi:SAM-dependent methyltransferase